MVILSVNLNSIVADDVYRITEQVNRTTGQYKRLKHHKVDEYRDVPLPARVKQGIEWYADKHGTVDGYLLRHPSDPTRTFPHYHIANQWKQIKKAGQIDIPDGMVVYSLRHFFASNCLTGHRQRALSAAVPSAPGAILGHPGGRPPTRRSALCAE
ncbi:hypothetical protein ACH49O_19850 [Streptomyces coeruleorubidus]|uniref:hypothetical protein n=1 Tax=Streptomyces coeruleorubidus TaxID=116188 RepID=UPI0033FAAEAC